MTFKRDKKADIKETNKLILKNVKPKFSGESWLGHTKDCGIIDHELLDGATREQLIKRSGRAPSGVDVHIQHLKSEHGLNISKPDGMIKFSFFHLSENKILTESELRDLLDIDIQQVKKHCVLKLENNEGIVKWYSIGIDAPDKEQIEITPLNISKGFAMSLLNKKAGDFVNFGNGFKVLEIKKYLSS